MPIYEYKCHSCGQKFEKIEKFSDAPMEIHADGCGGPVERLISAPAFQFKGTGWYVTDYAKSNGSSPNAGKNGSDSKGDSHSESKSESGSDSKSESKSSSGSDASSSSAKTSDSGGSATTSSSASSGPEKK